jgi:hypothetical protein
MRRSKRTRQSRPERLGHDLRGGRWFRLAATHSEPSALRFDAIYWRWTPEFPMQDYQNLVLPHVSRTFALTIPQLPHALRAPVTNAYLLCRIADTIEDEPAVSPPETIALMQRFKEAVAGRGTRALARDLVPLLSDRTLPSERDLVANMARVIRVTAQFEPAQRAAIVRCVELMCFGMPRFQFNASIARSRALESISTITAITWPASSAKCSRNCSAATRRRLLRIAIG